MQNGKLNKKDKNAIIITLIIGAIGQFFIESAMDIVLLCLCIYLIHRYIATTDNLREYDSYEFKDKAKYDKGRRLFAGLAYVYIVFRIIFMILNPQNAYAFTEMLLIIIIYAPYETYLEKKYVINTNIIKEEKRVVLARKKVLLSVGIIIFVLFSLTTFNTFEKLNSESNIKYGIHEYKVSGTGDRRKLEIQVGTDFMMADENNENSKYFDTYLKDGKLLMKKQVCKSYLFMSTILFIILCFIESYPKDEKITSIAGNILLFGLLIFSMVNLNFDISNDKVNLSSYFHEYISK